MSAHQLAVTRDYVLVMGTAFLIEPEQMFFRGAARPEAQDTTLYIVRRRDLARGGGDVFARKVVIPRPVAHFVADYDDANGRITLHLTHGCGWLPSEWLRADDRRADTWANVRRELAGRLVPSSDQTPIARHVIDGETGERLAGELLYDEDFTWSVTLYTHPTDARNVGPARHGQLYWTSLGFSPELLTRRVRDLALFLPYRRVPMHSLPYRDGKRAALFRTDARTMRRADADGYLFPPGRAVSSPTFVPAAGRDGPKEGYVVCTVVSDDASTVGPSGDEIWIFDARDLAAGPCCRLAHPELDFAYTLHTAWLGAIAPRAARYRVGARADFGAAVDRAGADVRALFEAEIYPRFPG